MNQNQAINIPDQLAKLRENNRLLIKALEVAWDNRAFLPIKDRRIIQEALEKVKA